MPIVRPAKRRLCSPYQPGNNAHAFILRRYDTNAISLTTMFKVAFPGASEEDEKREMDWVCIQQGSWLTGRSSRPLTSATPMADEVWMWFALQGNGLFAAWPRPRSLTPRVSRHLALHLAPAYQITELVTVSVRS